jgi:hypothetical protein
MDPKDVEKLKVIILSLRQNVKKLELKLRQERRKSYMLEQIVAQKGNTQ